MHTRLLFYPVGKREFLGVALFDLQSLRTGVVYAQVIGNNRSKNSTSGAISVTSFTFLAVLGEGSSVNLAPTWLFSPVCEFSFRTGSGELNLFFAMST